MRVSKKKINKNLEKQIASLLYTVIADIHNQKEAELFLKDFLTETEREILIKRLAVAYWLSKNRDYEEIKNSLAVSSTTIANLVGQLKKRGLQLALKKIEAEQWADKWASKIGKIMKFGRK